MKISTNWLKDFVELAPPIPRIADRLTLAGLEVKKVETLENPQDVLFEIEITSNRPDWLSHIGVAREIAAVEGLSLKLPAPDSETGRNPPPGWKINVKDLEGCPYYTGVLIEGITATKTPDFMVHRLAACGIRSVSLIVDITNYVLLEYGQPLHAFDADLLQGKEIQVRKAKSGEKILAINGATLDLKQEDLVIADSGHAIAIAGVMGGKGTEISERTRNVFLESAFFDPARVRKTSRRHQLSTDSSYRFERRVDPEGVDYGRQRALALIKQYAKPRHISAVIKAGEKPGLKVKSIHFRDDEIRATLGCEIKSTQVASILTRLGCDAKQHAPGSWKIGVPSFRPDLERPVDLIEEIARIFGYENIPETLPERAPGLVGESARLRIEKKLRRFLCGLGLHETVTFSLISDQGLDPASDLATAVQIVNPLHHGLHWMRPTLVTGFLGVIQRNINAGADSIPLFEIANTYRSPGKQKHPAEERVCAIALYGKFAAKSWKDAARPVSFYDLKGIVEAVAEYAGCRELCSAKAVRSYLLPETSQEIRMWQNPVGFFGQVAPAVLRQWDIKDPVFYAELSIDKMLAPGDAPRKFRDWPRYPAVERDLSLMVRDEVRCSDLMHEIRALGGGLVSGVGLFDLFRGKRVPEGFKNLAFRVVYRSPEKTLIAEEIQKLHDRIAETLVKKYQAQFQK